MNESDSSAQRRARCQEYGTGGRGLATLATARQKPGLDFFRLRPALGAQASDSNTFIYGTVQPIPSVGPLLFDNNGADEEMLKALKCTVKMP